MDYDAGNGDHIEAVTSFDNNWNEQLISDLATVLETKQGRRVVWSILEQCGIHNEFPSDHVDMLRAAGKRDLGLAVREWILTSNSDAYTLMRNEDLDKQQIRKELING